MKKFLNIITLQIFGLLLSNGLLAIDKEIAISGSIDNVVNITSTNTNKSLVIDNDNDGDVDQTTETISSVGFTSNSNNAYEYDIATTNNFKLNNGTDDIPYSLTLNSNTFDSNENSAINVASGGDIAASNLNFECADSEEPTSAGTYSDSITISTATA